MFRKCCRLLLPWLIFSFYKLDCSLDSTGTAAMCIIFNSPGCGLVGISILPGQFYMLVHTDMLSSKQLIHSEPKQD